jgi:hypothetical protein
MYPSGCCRFLDVCQSLNSQGRKRADFGFLRGESRKSCEEGFQRGKNFRDRERVRNGKGTK